MKILIAEDNVFSSKLLIKALERADYEVVHAEDGDQAWEMMQAEDAPSIALLDWMMPGLSGIDVCEKIRSLTRVVPVYIIMLTAKADRDDVLQGFAAGADDYIKKPFESAELIARIRVGERLVRQQLLMHTLIDALPDPIYVKDSRGLYLGYNEAYATFSGVEKDQIGAKKATDIFPAGQAQKTHMDDLRALAADEPLETEEWVENAQGENVCHYSKRIPFAESSSGLRGLVVLSRDLSYERLGDKQIRHQHKQAALGSMINNVSHELKNICGAILGFADLGLEPGTTTEQAQEYLLEIQKAGDSGKKLLEQVLDASHPEQMHMVPLRLQDVISQSMDLVKAMKPKQVQISLDLDQNCSSIYGDSVQLQQILLNLSVNAFYALDQKADARIEIGLKEEQYASDEEECACACVTFKDNGSGISVEDLPRIFNAEFTTKEMNGSGLGLYIIQGIIDRHQATIEVQSQLDQGTEFTLRFPIKS